MAIITRWGPNKMYLDEVFDNFMFSKLNSKDFNNMRCDIYEKDSIYYLEIDIPGFDKNEIKVEVDNNNYLTIVAEKNNEIEQEEGKNYIRRERNYGRYQRSFYVGDIDREKIEAEFIGGILKIIIPKKEDIVLSNHNVDIK